MSLQELIGFMDAQMSILREQIGQYAIRCPFRTEKSRLRWMHGNALCNRVMYWTLRETQIDPIQHA